MFDTWEEFMYVTKVFLGFLNGATQQSSGGRFCCHFEDNETGLGNTVATVSAPAPSAG